MEPYVHQTQGRIRVRSLYIKYNPKTVAKNVKQLKAVPGIKDVQHRLHAGSVAVLYDPLNLSCDAVMAMIANHGWMKEDVQTGKLQSDAFQQVMQHGAKTLIKTIAMRTLKKTFAGTLVSVALAMKS